MIELRLVATLGRSRDWEEGNRGVWGPGDTLGVGYMRVLICKLGNYDMYAFLYVHFIPSKLEYLYLSTLDI